jgi:hypothetical protein
MKKIAISLAAGAFLCFAACKDNNNKQPSKEKGEEQVTPPVMNSGPETEAERATEAVKKDSANSGNDRNDSVTGSNPHH